MKHLKYSIATCGLGLLLCAGAASADIVEDTSGAPIKTDQGTTAGAQTQIVGSDTLNEVMDSVLSQLVTAGSVLQITNYVGQGSAQGQRQMEGSPTAGTSELPCTVGGASDASGGLELNPGCEEIAPMSREMDKNICDDDITSTTETGNNKDGEAIAICSDGVVVITDNASNTQYADTLGQCATGTSSNAPDYTVNANYAHAGKFRDTGTIPADSATGAPAYAVGNANPLAPLAAWKDVLRLVYTGCDNTGNGVLKSDGVTPDLTCGTVDRITRCLSPVRKNIVNHWEYMVEGGVAGDPAVDCNGGDATNNNCAPGSDGGLRMALRRDDGSGTTGVFLSLLSLGSSITQRASLIGGLPLKITPIASTGNMFCDGGDVEGFWPDGNTCTPGTVSCYDANQNKTVTCPSGGPTNGVCPLPFYGDPLVKPCRAEDDLCDPDGKIGIVRPIRTPSGNAATQYPPNQCSFGKFWGLPFLNTSLPVCPDGSQPSAGQCLFPYYQPPGGTACNPGDANACMDPTNTTRTLSCPSTGTGAGICPTAPVDFNCLNVSSQVPALPLVAVRPGPGAVPPASRTVDGRSYNYVNRTSAGVVQFLGTNKPDVASWRQNTAVLNAGLGAKAGGPIGTLAGTSFACNDPDATRQIGCIVGNTACTIGWAGREAAGNAPQDALQEPLRLNADSGTTTGEPADPEILAATYPFSRDLFLSAIGGFENIMADCVARSGGASITAAQQQFCTDEVTIATEFFNNTTRVQNACTSAGFIKRATGAATLESQSSCVGAAAPKAANGLCGAPASQPLASCTPM